MAEYQTFTEEELDALRALDTPTIANCLERLPIRTWDEGFMLPEIKAIAAEQETVVGYAITLTMAAKEKSDRAISREETWQGMIDIPSPSLFVVQDLDYPDTIGSYWGEVQGNIGVAFGCVGAITDGGVRDLKECEEMGFALWAKEILVSHAYVHPRSINEPVTVGGLTVNPGDLMAADRHGVVNIPFEAVREVPKIAKLEAKAEAYVIDLCQSGEELTIDTLKEAMAKRSAVFSGPGAAY